MMSSDLEEKVSKATDAPKTEEAKYAQAGPTADGQSDAASSDEYVRDQKSSLNLTKWQKVKGVFSRLRHHLWRFKWWYLGGLVIFLAIFLPILFKVIVPAIIQRILDSQALPIYGGTIQVVSPVTANLSFDTCFDSGIPATLRPVDLDLYNDDVEPYAPFIKVRVPDTLIDGKTNLSIADQTHPVDNATQMSLWLTRLFLQPTVRLGLRGKPEIRLGLLSYHPQIRNTVEFTALSRLRGFGIDSMNFILQPNRTTEFNVNGRLNIPNDGPLKLGLGNVTFNLLAGDIRIGLINLNDLFLKSGLNKVPFEGNIFFDQLVPNLSEILDSQKGPLSNGKLELAVTGNQTFFKGDRIKYLEDVLNPVRLSFNVSVITLLGDVVSGFLDGDMSSLLDVVGGAFGNATLLEHMLSHWDPEGSGPGLGGNNDARGLIKRGKSSGSLMGSLLRLKLSRRGL